MDGSNKTGAGRLLAAGVCVALLAGCGALGGGGRGGQDPSVVGLETQSVVLGEGGASLRVDFVLGDGAGADEGRFGPGFIVVSQAEAELQAIEHHFTVPRSQIDAKGWLRFEDFNGDGWQDFVVTHGTSAASGLPVMSLYQFDPRQRRFVPVAPVSKRGELQAAGPGCVALRYAEDGRQPEQERFCFSAQAGRWVQQVAAPGALTNAEVAGPCEGGTPDLARCRQARVALDKSLQAQWGGYRNAMGQLLTRSNGKQHATQFMRHSQASHAAWLQYREAFCATHVREQALPARWFHSGIESCKYDMARQQLQQYETQRLRLQAPGEGER
ncbi:hypothetical protein [Hydrogenophaga sp. NFH-34]|uniref:hypothetical protein n=1 Tax=Hydrogenophaga sp. NFH-34 TaxID=2744446 RepID=UPI001F23C479|nr:hypothetical protein [Hydrogenophaga sp. NFH-34]